MNNENLSKCSSYILILIFLVCATGCGQVYTQIGKHIEGAVVDQGTGTAIVGAKVMYQDQPGTAVLTGPRGAFMLERQVVTFSRSAVPRDRSGLYGYPVVALARGYAPGVGTPSNSPDPESLRIELHR